MKKYKKLVPVALIVLMGVGIYSTVSSAAEESNKYQNYLKKARKQAKLEVVEDAVSNYEKALELKDSVDIRIELGEVYVKNEWNREALNWGENLVERYPESADAYTFLLQQYITNEEYTECFKLRDQAEVRKAESKQFDKLMDQIAYTYEYGFYDYDDVSMYSNGLCAVRSDDSWGYADFTGEKTISGDFQWAGAFSSDGVAAVQDKNGDFYYISDSGNKKITLQNLKQCSALGMSINQIIPAADDSKYAYYDQEFKKIAGDFDYASAINGEIGAVCEDGIWYFVDQEGKKTEKNGFKSIVMDEKGIAFRNDRSFAEKDDGYVMLDVSGKQIGKQVYEDAKLFLESDGLAAIKENGKWGYIDKDGKIVIEPQFEEAHSFLNGYAAVKTHGKWGYINEKGKLVIEEKFIDARDFNEQGNVFVLTGNQWKLLKLNRNNYK